MPAIDPVVVRSWVEAAGVLADRAEQESAPQAAGLAPGASPDARVRRQIEAMTRAAAGDALGAAAAVTAMNDHPPYAAQTLMQLARYRALAGDVPTALALLDAAPWSTDGYTWKVAGPAELTGKPLPTTGLSAAGVVRPVVAPLPANLRRGRQMDLLHQIEPTGNAVAVARLAAAIPGTVSALSAEDPATQPAGASTRPWGPATRARGPSGAATRSSGAATRPVGAATRPGTAVTRPMAPGDVAAAVGEAGRITDSLTRQSALENLARGRYAAGDAAGARSAVRAAADDVAARARSVSMEATLVAPHAWQNLAACYLDIGDRPAALEALGRAAAAVDQMPAAPTDEVMDSAHAEPLRRIAAAQAGAGDTAGSIETLKKAVAYIDKAKRGPTGSGWYLGNLESTAHADLARAYGRAGRTADLDALLQATPDEQIRKGAAAAGAEGLLEAGRVDEALAHARGLTAPGKAKVLAGAAEARLASGDKAAAAKLAGDALGALKQLNGLDSQTQARILKVQLGAGDLAGARATAAGAGDGQLPFIMAEVARDRAASGDDTAATAIADAAPPQGKARVLLAAGLGRLHRGDRAGADGAFRAALEAASTGWDPAAPGRIAIEAAAAQLAAGDAAGARATYAAGARTTALVNQNPHMMPDALKQLAAAQIAGGDFQGAVDWIAALGQADLRRSLYLQLASHLLGEAAEGRAGHALRLAPTSPAAPASPAAAPAGTAPAAAPTFQGKPMQYWLDALKAGTGQAGFAPQDREREALASSAVTALAGIGKPAVPDLIALLKQDTAEKKGHFDDLGSSDPSLAPLFKATAALSRIGTDAVPALADLIQSVPEKRAAGRAAFALQSIGAPAAATTAQLLSDPNPAVRWRAADIMYSNPAIASPAIAALVKASKDADPQVRQIAVRALQSACQPPTGPTGVMPPLRSDARVVAALAEALSDSNLEVRAAAAVQLPFQEPASLKPVVPKMLAVLEATPKPVLGNDPNLMVRRSLMLGLGRSGAPEAVAVIIKHVDSTNKGEAARALADIGKPAIGALTDLLKKGGADRTFALDALRYMTWTRPEEQQGRPEAAAGAARRADTLSGAVPELTILAADPDPQTAQAAKEILAAVRPAADRQGR